MAYDPLKDIGDSNPLPVTGAGGGGGGGAVTVADGADVTQGAKSDATWDGTAAASGVSIWRYIGSKIEAMRAALAGGVGVTGTFWQATQPVSGVFFQATQPVSAASLPIPTGASTASKQPALGTAGTASADVLSVQGVASMTPLSVSGTFWQATQPVSGAFWQATQPISAASLPLPSLAATSTKQSDGSQKSQVVDGSGNVIGSTSNALDVNIKSGGPSGVVTQPTGTNLHTVVDSGTVTTVSTVTNLSQLSGVAIAMNTGVRAAGVQRVTIATDDVVPVTGTFWQATQPVSGAFFQATQPVSIATAPVLVAGSAIIGKVGIDQTTPGTTNAIAPIAGQNGVQGGSGAITATTQRVTLATDAPTVAVLGATTDAKVITDANGSIQQYLRGLVSQWIAGTLVLGAGSNIVGKVGIDQTAGQNEVVEDASARAGGISSTARLASAAASTNATNVKTSAGRIYSVQGYNAAGYPVYLVLYDSAANPPVPGTTTIRKKIPIPAGAGFAFDWPIGMSFAAGIGYAFTKLAADADTTALAAADVLQFNMDYV